MDRAVMQALFMVQEGCEEFLNGDYEYDLTDTVKHIERVCRGIMRLSRDNLERRFDQTAFALFEYGIEHFDKREKEKFDRIMDKP